MDDIARAARIELQRVSRHADGDAGQSSGGVAIDFASQTERDDFLRRMEEYFAAKRFMNAADAFDTVKAYALEQTSKRN